MTSKSKRDPEFVIYVGPMFGAKTSRLLSAIDRCKYQNLSVVAFKPKIDDRYDLGSITTHSGMSIPATCINSGPELLEFLEKKDCDVVAVDEAFMMKDISSVLIELHKSGKTILVSSIQLSAAGTPFEEIQSMMPYATRIEVCPAICPICSKDAYFTAKISGEKTQNIDVGGADKYQPRCFEHYHFSGTK